jgi:hypothetical protein
MLHHRQHAQIVIEDCAVANVNMSLASKNPDGATFPQGPQ